ncbi:sigma-E factor negative regulatory protein [Xylophilus sp.]|uniref:sigma-E factor negative regulatory protein n=1 Tax=Xylophilus sp. TaxID=2653893 RepID=UPI002D7FDF73|nr:sigma-E factor negative regulatory protein [Xylophilus sp.]
MNKREAVSALADGQLRGDDFAQAVRWALDDPEGRQAWRDHHVVGDLLRSTDLAARRDGDAFVARLRERLVREPAIRPIVVAEVQPIALPREAANASVFRWKIAAGCASLAAVAALAWTAAGPLPQQDSGGPQVAAVPASTANPGVVAVAHADGQVVLRDPRLDELLMAHRQFGGASALQMPAGFLRNATFEEAGR